MTPRQTSSTPLGRTAALLASLPRSGNLHIAARGDAKTTTIINPAKIPDARRAAQVCGQCHNRGESIAEAVKVPGGPKHYGYAGGAAGYLPGKTLYNYYVEKPGEWPDGSPKQHHQQYNDWKSPNMLLTESTAGTATQCTAKAL